MHAEVSEVNWLPEVKKIVAGVKSAFSKDFPTTALEVAAPTPRLTELTQELENSALPPVLPTPLFKPTSFQTDSFLDRDWEAVEPFFPT